jgi:CheY-like chemotaxis protein
LESADLIPFAPMLGGAVDNGNAVDTANTVTLARHTILLIEDNVSNFQLIQMFLDDLNDVCLVGAIQGGLGVELAFHHRPDLILLGLHIPDTMSDDVLRRLQARPETRDILVMILSADATPSQINLLLALGARQYLTKPLDVKQFLQAVSETIHTHQN